MHRFYHPALAQLIAPADGPASSPEAAPSPALSAAALELTKEESHHLAKVLRVKTGQEVMLFDGAGTVAIAMIVSIGSRVTAQVVSVHHEPSVLPHIIIASAIPKGPRADAMIEQLSQVGCDQLIPLRTARSIVDPRDAKLERFERACIESAKQCGRSHVMKIAPLMDLKDVLDQSENVLRLIALPGNDSQPADAELQTAKEVLILIGPEGGWTDQEIDAARRSEFRPWTLGPFVMRIETAAVAAAVLIRGRR